MPRSGQRSSPAPKGKRRAAAAGLSERNGNAGRANADGDRAVAAATAQPSTRPYRGKSPEVRRSEQHERILLAARDVFARRGYASAGIDEIVAGARVSRTSFYEFFENKEQCLLAVFALGMERVTAALMEVVPRKLAPAERIRAEVAAIAAAFAADPEMARIILIEVVGATPVAEQARVRARQDAAAVVEAQLNDYPQWKRRSAHERRLASIASMAAIVEPLSELVATSRLHEWETIVDPVSEFVVRALVLR
jgi:AcrR family transcriptional regulator